MSKITAVNCSFSNGTAYKGLTKAQWITYKEMLPSECATALAEGIADIALIPCAELHTIKNAELLPFGINAKKQVNSVCLFAKEDLKNIGEIFIDNRSRTSVRLLYLFAKTALFDLSDDLKFTLLPADEIPPIIDKDRAGLLIGDECLAQKGKFPKQWDLAEIWWTKTNLPLVFAIWVSARNKLTHRHKLEFMDIAKRGIDELNNSQNGYLRDSIKYSLGKAELKGLNLLYKKFAQHNILPSPPLNLQPFLTWPNTSLDELLDKASKRKRLSVDEACQIALEANTEDLAKAADSLRKKLHPEGKVSYIVERNINYTNVCNVYCSFCAFYSPEKTRKGAYTLSKKELTQKMNELVAAGGYQVLLQGGLNPDLKIEYYEDLFRWLKNHYPKVNLHALSTDEIIHIAKVSNLSIKNTFRKLIDAGLGSLPGAGAEILIDRVRKIIAPLKSTAREWLSIHERAHSMGLRSTATMMFGVGETLRERILHLEKIRSLQDITKGFTAFICWPYQQGDLKLKATHSSTDAYLRTQALARLYLDNIDNIQSSWVTVGPQIGQLALSYGANDFGSVMFEENVVSATGTTFSMSKDSIETYIKDAGFTPYMRDMAFEEISP